MNRPVKTLRLTPDQINRAVQAFLNEKVFREPVEVCKVEVTTTYDGQTGEAVVTLVSEQPTSEAPA